VFITITAKFRRKDKIVVGYDSVNYICYIHAMPPAVFRAGRGQSEYSESLKPSLGVTGLAERLQVIIIVSAAIIKGADVMNFIGGDMKSTFEARLTERVLGIIQVSDFSPVPVVMLGIAMGTVIFTVSLGLMCNTESPVCKARAIGVATNTRSLKRH
jgi:hypothetical protein